MGGASERLLLEVERDLDGIRPVAGQARAHSLQGLAGLLQPQRDMRLPTHLFADPTQRRLEELAIVGMDQIDERCARRKADAVALIGGAGRLDLQDFSDGVNDDLEAHGVDLVVIAPITPHHSPTAMPF